MQSSLQKFKIVKVRRRSIKAAPYNPRVIDEHAKRKLQTNLQKVGLLMPLVWNQRTGNLVAGHQRLAAMDALEGTDDYEIDVAAVDLDDKTEKQQNVFMNNPSAQGMWDNEKLDALVSELGDYKEMGFDRIDLEDLISSNTLGAMFEAQKMATPEAVEALNEVKAFSAEAADLRRESNQQNAEIKKKMEEAKKDFHKANDKNYDTEFYLVVVFTDEAERIAFLHGLNLDHSLKYVDGARLIAAVEAKVKGI